MTAVKNDLNRLGIFQEMSYVTVQDPYVPSSKFNFNEAAYKGKQMLPGPVKDKVTGLQDGYFDKQFPRIFDKESYSDPIGNRRRERMEAAKKNLTNKPFITFQGEKKPEGLGSLFGTFAGKVEHFSGKPREGKPAEKEKPNVKTNPSKKGTGYGYPNVGLTKYPEYKSDKYDSTDSAAKQSSEQHKKSMLGPAFKSGKFHQVVFDKNPYLTQKDGATYKEMTRSKSESDIKKFKPSSHPKTMGNLEGFFTKYPDHKDDPFKHVQYFQPIKKVVNSSGKLFAPHQGPKSKRQDSVINKNIRIKINSTNYRQANSLATYNLHAVPTTAF